MQQEIVQEHRVDDEGNPAGGTTQGLGLSLEWQDGPLGRGEDRVGANGTFVETVLAAAIGRLEFYNSGKFKCRENSIAITKLEEALHWCNHRTAAREARGVEGTHSE